MELDELIRQGIELRGTPLGSPRFAIWQNDVRAAVAPYGEVMRKVAENALEHGVIIMGEDNINDEAIASTVEFLETLKSRQPEASRVQAALITQKRAEARHTLQSKLGNITVKGNATFGDNSPINQVNVGEFMAALINEAEQKLPEGEEKNNILANLKAVATSPAFAGVAGAVVGEVIKKLMGS